MYRPLGLLYPPKKKNMIWTLDLYPSVYTHENMLGSSGWVGPTPRDVLRGEAVVQNNESFNRWAPLPRLHSLSSRSLPLPYSLSVFFFVSLLLLVLVLLALHETLAFPFSWRSPMVSFFLPNLPFFPVLMLINLDQLKLMFWFWSSPFLYASVFFVNFLMVTDALNALRQRFWILCRINAWLLDGGKALLRLDFLREIHWSSELGFEFSDPFFMPVFGFFFLNGRIVPCNHGR